MIAGPEPEIRLSDDGEEESGSKILLRLAESVGSLSVVVLGLELGELGIYAFLHVGNLPVERIVRRRCE